MWDEFFRGKRITLMGLGLLGRGIGDALFLAQHGADLIVTDMKTREQLKESVEKLQHFKNVTFVLGEHRREDFQNRDLIIRAANVPLDSAFLQEAEKNGISVEQSVSFFVRLLRDYKKSLGRETEKYLVGVTGSKGKTTVTYLIHAMLAKAFPERRVRLGGNIQGISTLAYLDDLAPDDMFVLELDSWQLQTFNDMHTAPHVSVFTTFLPDHMNYYHGDMDRYFNDKANIFCFQGEEDVCFVAPTVIPWVEKHHFRHAKRMREGERREYANRSESLRGEHNTENIALAADAARALGVSDAIINDIVANFTGVPGRLQFLREVDGVKYYNDTTATVPDATRAALKALGSSSGKNIVLIMGGANKEVAAFDLLKELPDFVRVLVLLKGSGTDIIRSLLHSVDFESISEADSMQDAVQKARAAARAGDIILLSPAFASFGMFINEYDRGEQFMREVEQIS